MTRQRTGLVLLTLVLAVGVLRPRRAEAANEEQAREYLDKATAAYALNHYAVAAENFEKAFELKPDAALLYNAAQSYRLAGNKERALELYESYLRVYGGSDKRSQVEARIRDLKQAIAHDKAVATSPPYTTLPVGGGGSAPRATTPPPAQAAPSSPPPPVAPPPAPTPVTPAPVAPVTVAVATPPPAVPPAPAPAAAASPTLLTQTAGPPAENDSLTRKPWFWVAVGGGVVAATVVVLLLAAGGTNPATASLGRVSGN